MRNIAIRLLIIVVIAGGAYVLRDRLSGHVSDLKVGDCFDATAEVTVADLQHHPCTEPHSAEVVFVGNYESGGALPSDAQFESFVTERCAPALLTYLGGQTAVEADPGLLELTLGYYVPIQEGWDRGDRGVICYAQSEGQALTKTLKAASQ